MAKLRLGFIGWLLWEEGPDWETVAWCDIHEPRLRHRAQQHPAVALYTDWRQMLRHGGLDVVCIAVPNYLHCEMACAFLEAGQHVFLEKPMAITREQLDRLIVTQRRSGRSLTIDFEMRVSPFAGRLKRLLDCGDFGELRRIEFIHHRGGYLEEGSGIWRTRPETSGGLFLEEPVHGVDIFRFFAGEIKAVQALSGPNVLKNYQVPDNCCAHFFFESGAVGTLLTTHTLSAVTKDPKHWPMLGHDMNMIFTCEQGTIAVDFIASRILTNRYEDHPPGARGTRVVFERAEDYSLRGGHMSFFHDIDLMRREFFRRCARGEPPVQDPLDAWRSHIVCLAVEESATTDFRRIEVDYTLPQELG